jgi:hypothetical protein
MIVKLEQDENGDLILPLGDELCESVGWKIGDTIVWKDNEDGSWTMSKKPTTKIVLVDALVSYRMRYAVELAEDSPESWALDTVTMAQAAEFSQECLGEQIVSHRVITETEFLQQFDKDNSYLAGWTAEKKFESALTRLESTNE